MSTLSNLEKGKKAQIGDVHQWAEGPFRKVREGEWAPFSILGSGASPQQLIDHRQRLYQQYWNQDTSPEGRAASVMALDEAHRMQEEHGERMGEHRRALEAQRSAEGEHPSEIESTHFQTMSLTPKESKQRSQVVSRNPRALTPEIVDEALDIYFDRDNSSWVDPAIEKSGGHATSILDAKNKLNSEQFAEAYRDDIAGFGGVRIQLSVKGSPGKFLQDMEAFSPNGESITSALERGASSLSPPFPMSPTMDQHERSLLFYNHLLGIHPKFRGNSWSSQLYMRQEDFLSAFTSNLSNPEKQNVATVLYANADVGMYYWMTQGFRYESVQARFDHLDSLVDTLDHVLKRNDPILLERPARKANGQVVSSLETLGFDCAELKNTRKGLLRAAKKSYDMSGDVEKEPEKNDRLIEPWEVLHENPSDNLIWVDSDESPGMIPCTLIKFLALNSTGWDGIKHAHAMTDRDAQGIVSANRRRAVSALRAAQAGTPWASLDEKTNSRLKKLVGS